MRLSIRVSQPAVPREKAMAEEAKGNGQSEMPQAVPEGQQQLIVNAQYVKDLSFENPRAPQ